MSKQKVEFEAVYEAATALADKADTCKFCGKTAYKTSLGHVIHGSLADFKACGHPAEFVKLRGRDDKANE